MSSLFHDSAVQLGKAFAYRLLGIFREKSAYFVERDAKTAALAAELFKPLALILPRSAQDESIRITLEERHCGIISGTLKMHYRQAR